MKRKEKYGLTHSGFLKDSDTHWGEDQLTLGSTGSNIEQIALIVWDTKVCKKEMERERERERERKREREQGRYN